MELPEGRNIVVTIRTVFEYGPEAVDRLINTYRQKKYSSHVECRFNPVNQSFVLEGDSGHSELAFYEFMDLIQKEINAETMKRRQPKEYVPIRRSKLTQLNSSAIVWSELGDESQYNPKDQSNGIMSSNDPKYAHITVPPSLMPSDLTGNYKLTEFWEPQINRVDFTAMLHLHGGRPLSAEIAKVCNCAIYPNWEKRNVKIGANTRVSIERAVKKLRKIEELFKRGFEPFSVILVHPEEKKKFEFKLVSLDKQGELARTTIFPNSSKWYQHPTEKLFLIRMMEFSPLKERFVPCPIEVAPIWAAYTENGPGPRDWMGYTYNGWGSADMNPLLAMERPDSNNGSDSEGNPDLTGFDPEDLVGQYNTPGGAPSAASTEEASRGRPRSDGGFDLGSRPLGVDERLSASTHSISGSAVRRPRVRPGKEPASIDNTENPGGPMFRYQTKASSHYQDLASLQFNDLADDTIGRFENTALSHASSVSTDESELGRKNEKHLGTGIELSARPPPKSSNKFGGFSSSIVEPKEIEPTSTTIRSIRTPKERKPRPDSEASDSGSKPSEKKEQVSETDTRKIQRTMRQNAPSRKKLHDGTDESMKLKKQNNARIHEVFTECFEHVRSWQGRVSFELNVGRIVMVNVPKAISKVTIDWNEWEHTLEKTEDMHPVFTDMVTSEFYDAQFICELKMSKAEMLFSSDWLQKKVTYEFHCTHKGKHRIMEVDARTFEYTIYGDIQNFGIVHWACPLRAWDAKFNLSGAKFIPNEISVFKSLFESLYIPGDSEIPDISFLVRGRDFHVNRVLVKRQTRRKTLIDYVTLGNDIDLAVTEIQEMVIQRHKIVPEQFRAMARDRVSMMRAGLLHFKFSFIPNSIEKALQQNLDLEIGSEVNWTTDEMIGDLEQGTILPGLRSLTNTVLRKIDDIGYNNAISILEEQQQQRQQQLQQEQYQ